LYELGAGIVGRICFHTQSETELFVRTSENSFGKPVFVSKEKSERIVTIRKDEKIIIVPKSQLVFYRITGPLLGYYIIRKKENQKERKAQ
jgi:hypothetical protein